MVVAVPHTSPARSFQYHYKSPWRMFGARKIDVESELGKNIPSTGCALVLCSLSLSQWIAQVGRSGRGKLVQDDAGRPPHGML